MRTKDFYDKMKRAAAVYAGTVRELRKRRSTLEEEYERDYREGKLTEKGYREKMKELADEFEANQAEAYTRMAKVKAEYAAALAEWTQLDAEKIADVQRITQAVKLTSAEYDALVERNRGNWSALRFLKQYAADRMKDDKEFAPRAIIQDVDQRLAGMDVIMSSAEHAASKYYDFDAEGDTGEFISSRAEEAMSKVEPTEAGEYEFGGYTKPEAAAKVETSQLW